jgi:hypothetical protein
MSEINFIQRAYKNYNSIMNHESQRIATISSIQNAEKVAMKDIEFKSRLAYGVFLWYNIVKKKVSVLLCLTEASHVKRHHGMD